MNAKATTVGAIHSIEWTQRLPAKAVYPYAWLAPNLPPQMFAAWCWYQPTPHHYKLVVVAPSAQGGNGWATFDTGQGSNGGGPPQPGPLAVT